MAVSLFASCAPKLLQKSHAITNATNWFSWPNPNNQDRNALQLPTERGGGVVQGYLLSTEPANPPRWWACCFSRSPSHSRLHTAQQQAQGKPLYIYSFPCYWDLSTFWGCSRWSSSRTTASAGKPTAKAKIWNWFDQKLQVISSNKNQTFWDLVGR